MASDYLQYIQHGVLNAIRKEPPPFYLYDVAGLIDKAHAILAALDNYFPHDVVRMHLPLFANPCLPLVRTLADLDSRIGVLVNSTPELLSVKRYFSSAVPRLVFASGILPSDEIKCVCDNADLFFAASRKNLFAAAELCGNQHARLGIRVDFFMHTSRGLQPDVAREVLASSSDGNPLVAGIHAYVGHSRTGFPESLALAEMLLRLARGSARPLEVNFSGGWPFDYSHESSSGQINDHELNTYLSALKHIVYRELGSVEEYLLAWEPGKYLLAPFGFFVARVTDVEEHPNVTADVHLDASFVQLPAPKIRQRVHKAFLQTEEGVAVQGREHRFCRLWGKSGLSTDTVMPEPLLIPLPRPGDILVIRDVGAYGRAGSYNFLGIQKPSELALNEEGEITVLRKRQGAEHLLEDLAQ